ncbi:MAG: hypothetical protein KGH49_02045 [Candidatus Micrarchaeota archaeon]|nr:hypothetical protein [Candidatus Micrarchaeota archaeon]
MAWQTLSRIDPKSVARIYSAFGAIFGFIFLGTAASFAFGAFGLGGGLGFGAGLILGLIFGAVVGAVLGFLAGLIGSAIYNFAAHHIGGIKLNLNASGASTTIDTVHVLSYAKISLVTGIIYGIIAAIFFSVLSPFIISGIVGAVPSLPSTSPLSSQLFGLYGNLVAIVVIYLVVAIPLIALVGTAVAGWLYNRLRPRIGGITFNLSKGVITSVRPKSVAKIYFAIELIFQLVIQVVRSAATFSTTGPLGIVTAIIAAIVAAVITFVVAIVVFMLYNYLARKLGGVAVTFSS